MKRWNWRAGLAGAAAGVANGLFGAGGGMVLVPLLGRLCKVEEKACFATALSVIVPLSLVSLAVYAQAGQVAPGDAVPYLIGGFFGGLAGGLLMKKMDVRALHAALGAVIVWGGVRLWL